MIIIVNVIFMDGVKKKQQLVINVVIIYFIHGVIIILY